ncbi:MAG TPA: sigma 54-interacting transcriptional regulator [Candidatus Babeliales bacterium]|nr:sigma 54-interacting transcriptional regulator [Candidatus Babeliales bacterium]
MLKILVPHGLRSSTTHKPWLFLLGVLIGSMFGDFAWIIKLLHEVNIVSYSYSVFVFFARISWAFLIIQYQSLALFIESLTHKNFILGPIHKALCLISIIFASFFFFEAFCDPQFTTAETRNAALALPPSWSVPLEMRIMRYVAIYLLHILVLPGLLATFWRLYTQHLPKILKKQLRILLLYFMCPYVIIEALQASQFIFPLFRFNLYPIVAFSTILITCAIVYCIPKVMGLRFLNVESYVQSTYNETFIKDFKNLLEQLSHTNNFQELGQLTQLFFSNIFGISPRKTTLTVRNQMVNKKDHVNAESYGVEATIENFLQVHHDTITGVMGNRRILVHEELEFSNFYEESELRKSVLNFMESINANIFLPIYDKNVIIAYIVVEQSVHKADFFGHIEQDEMLIFARYLGNIINLMQHRNLKTLIYKEKELREELHRKHQEINQYKESIKSFLRESNEKEIGIIFYKNRRFIFGNTAVKKLININLNTHDGHPLTKEIKSLVANVTLYKTPQTSFTTDAQRKKMVLYAVPNLEQNNIIVMVYYPEISDLIARKIALLKDPTKWDYLLYLETTQSGQLVNQLIPGSGETLLNFKIDLLKLALSQKALLLEMPEEDIIPMVEIIHHISLREKLHILNLKKQSHTFDIAIQLFGINPLFDAKAANNTPLLSTLDRGTLFIKNIEYLDIETQKYLAEFLKYGFYRTYKGEEKSPSNVRIICSTQRNLALLVQQGNFAKDLFDVLNKTSLIMPSLTTLPEPELTKLAEGFTKQALQNNDFSTVLALTDRDKDTLNYNRPVSLHELKSKIKEMLIRKSHSNKIYQETHLNQVIENPDPELIVAAQLGKKALRDQKIMTLLWSKFGNQNKIAQFLGVNRSSINRRCKEYNLG